MRPAVAYEPSIDGGGAILGERKMRPIDSAWVHADKILEHYKYAKEKHPYFCDWVQPQGLTDNVKMYIKNSLSDMRNLIKKEVERKHLGWVALLNCEIWEIIDSLDEYDNTQAIEECYDAIAVLLRVIDVLEGRQKLGRTEEGEEAGGGGETMSADADNVRM